MELELQEFVRKPFPVKAVEVNFQNAYAVAEWCRGRVELKKTKLLGGAGKGEMDLPVVIFQGTGDNRNKEFTAGLGDWIAELRGNFRVFKKAQFKATFEPVVVWEYNDHESDCEKQHQGEGCACEAVTAYGVKDGEPQDQNRSLVDVGPNNEVIG